ncbi:L-amino acid N-acyltransferase YncA [Yoonia maritima]|uniref:L-amino acid N-acyltransferase YncA n=1 Tax=Yoonia maritima TaxID=1435347 RepID=A0A2T0VVG7_9RHOB|nr:GNAT family N-acetyltransferase [Yoonia maritima]PRY75663.1 L-amino acid N-acyltransferase YncA [Yoonia maritima]
MIIRTAAHADAADMTALLNKIITLGGSTAHQTPFGVAQMQSHYIAPSALISCQVAEDAGAVIGFQWLGWAVDPDDPMPADWGIIASFVSPDAAGKGVGQHLFRATKAAALEAGTKVIDATIRADNVAGLRYYSGLGFQDYDRLRNIPLRDGTPVDRIRKRFDL